MPSSNLARWGGLASIVTGLMWFVGYAGMAELLLPVLSNLGGHVILGVAGLLTVPALAGLFARDARRTTILGGAGYALAVVGAAVFSIGNLVEGIWLAEFGTSLFALGIMSLIVGVVLLGFGTLRAKVLPPWSVWPLVVGWATFLPIANSPAVLGHTFVLSLLAAGLLSAGWVLLGYALWSEKGEPIQQPARVR